MFTEDYFNFGGGFGFYTGPKRIFKSRQEEKVFQIMSHNQFYDGDIEIIFPIGSRLFENHNKDSDYDFIVVINTERIYYKKEISEDNYTLLIESRKSYVQKLKNHDPNYLITLYIPDEKVIYGEKIKQFELDYRLLYQKIIEEKEYCLNKSKSFFEQNKRISLKNLINSIRFISFGIQIFENEKIINYQIVNDLFHKIFSLDFEKWDDYYKKIVVYLNKLETNFKYLNDSFIKIQNEFSKKPTKPNTLTTLNFLKQHKIKELTKYFGIKKSNRFYGYILERSKSSNEKLPICQECSPLILDFKYNVLGMSPIFLNDTMMYDKMCDLFKGKTISSFPIEQSEEIAILFKYNNQWILHEKTNFKDSVKFTNYMNDHYIDFNKCYFFFSSQTTLKYVTAFDLTTFEEIKDPQFQIIFQPFLDYKQTVLKNFIRIDDIFKLYSLIPSSSKKYFIQDGEYNKILLDEPSNYLKWEISNKKIEPEYAMLLFLKFYGADQESFNYASEYFEYPYLKFFIKYFEKYEKLIHSIEESYGSNDDRDDEYSEIYKYLDNGMSIKFYFVNEKMDTFKNFLNYKRKRTKVSDEWKIIPMIEYFPDEIFQLIFQYVCPEILKYFSCGLISNRFEWLKSDQIILKEYIRKNNILRCFEYMSIFHCTPQFQMFSRCLPYFLEFKVVSRELINIFDNLYLMKPRELNEFEQKLYKTSDKKIESKTIVSYSKFIENLNSMFCFKQWKDLIDWKYFKIAGGSLLNCIINEQFDSTLQDVDLFFHDIINISSNIKFDRLFSEFFSKLDVLSHQQTEGYSDSVRTIVAKFGSKKIKFQLIYTKITYSMNDFLNAFDIDCCQILFNNRGVFVSPSFIQSINTGTFCSYKTMKQMDKRTKERMEKYQSRNFSLLLPIKFDFHDVTFVSGSFSDENNDEFEIVKQFFFMLKNN
eukprot:gene6718-10883_t